MVTNSFLCSLALTASLQGAIKTLIWLCNETKSDTLVVQDIAYISCRNIYVFHDLSQGFCHLFLSACLKRNNDRMKAENTESPLVDEDRANEYCQDKEHFDNNIIIQFRE